MKELAAILSIFWAYLVVIGVAIGLVVLCWAGLLYGVVRIIKLAWGG